MTKFRALFLGLTLLFIGSLYLTAHLVDPADPNIVSPTIASRLPLNLAPDKAAASDDPQITVVDQPTIEQSTISDALAAPISAVPTPPSQPVAATSTKTTTAAPKPAPAPQPVSCGGAFSQEFLCLLNQYRSSRGLGKLSYNSALAAVALKHSQWMANTGIFSHEGIDGSHLTERCATAGIVCRGENLARGAKSPQHLLDMWKASPGHDKILRGNFTTMGLGISSAYITMLTN